ncbi:MAG: 4-hydroxy-tetrahydrodipicolinate reductase [Dysgonamonadaceae bacterium]|jgi:4-hydroxy-tetrahydrodipicolinate reductase|nr:4-hydroxy-tetrahydrodipicolinate reductase [Dysgonamonadaceae bacterium]MDD3726818.1 4-hydroxy-tetrahydrodipicolinate reductase [Dysgonamonadaceae bacterium]MDD4245822.1 4-hydroxy-tetrahydrodipicolinate reductase [Dysgonamonadaceae bacterium]HUI32541.1 4-hydroxy-tetrahydrodipicolinate reductase [Dysgonamonadaceae bacterium]
MNIAIIGYGKMGREIEKICRERDHDIVCIIDVGDEDKFNSDEFKSAQVAIEFSSPESALENYRRAFAADVPVVSGTTGWLDNIDEVKEACEEEGKTFFYASNFSLGVNILFAVNSYLAKIMNNFPEYNVHIDETHHIHKLDAPSGTAITLAEGIMDSIEQKKQWKLNEETTDDDLRINSYREKEVPGIHTVKYESEVDEIEITHNAKSRKGFALGAVLAAEFTANKKGFLGMKDLLPF